MKDKLSFRRIATLVCVLVISFFVAQYCQPLIHGNEAAINIIVTVFSILAGFLVAIIAVVGDPALLPPGNWRVAEQERKKLDRRLTRHKALFMSYLITLGLIFLSLLAAKSIPSLGYWLERIFLFLGSLAFLYSLKLPGALIETQRERINLIIDQRRNEEGIVTRE
jgi:hypothetical protein